MRIGYGQVSTRDQHPEAQADALRTAGCDEVFVDKASGTLARRLELDGLTAARARGRTGGQKPKLGPRQVRLAREMHEDTGNDGKRRCTVAQIAAEFGVTRPTIYRHLTESS